MASEAKQSTCDAAKYKIKFNNWQKSIQFVLFQMIFINFLVFPAIKNLRVIIKELKMLLIIAAKNRTKSVLKHWRNKEIWAVLSTPAIVQHNLISK